VKSVCQTNIQALRLLLPVSHSVDLGHLDRGRGGVFRGSLRHAHRVEWLTCSNVEQLVDQLLDL